MDPTEFPSIIFDNHPDPMWIYDIASLCFLRVNAAAVDKYGYSEEEFLGMTLRDIRPSADIEALLDSVTRKSSGGLDEIGIWCHLTRAGDLLDVELHTHDLTFQGREARLVSARDVSRRIRAERRLQEMDVLLQLAGRAARLGAWRYELNPPQMIWSPGTAAIHGEPEDIQPSAEAGINYYAPEYRERIRARFNDCMAQGTPYDEVMQIITAKGRRVWVRSIGEPERDKEGAIVAVQGAFQDVSELMQARQESARLSMRLQETMENISDPFLLLDDDWCFSFVNAEAEKALERNRDELLGQKYWKAFPQARGSRFQREYEKARTSGKTSTFVEYFPPLQCWFDVSAYPTSDGLAIYFRDVTQERANQEQLKLLQNAISRLSDIVIITEAEPLDEPEGPKIVYVNEAFTRRTGYLSEEVIGRTPRFLQGPGTSRQEMDLIRSALEKWQPVRAELLNYTRDGEELWLELDIAPIADSNGRYTHWVSVERDITQRKRNERALRENEERFHLVAQATNDVIWDWDFGTDIIWWNEGLKSTFGHDPEVVDWGPETWSDHIHPADREVTVGSIYRAIEDPHCSNWKCEYRFCRADGAIATVVDRGFILRDGTGRAERMIGSMLDVTEQREMNARLGQSQKLEAVGQLTGGVAHDFNNLLTVITGNAELLQERLFREDDRMLAQMIVRAGLRGAALTHRLLAFARRQPLEPEPVDVNRLLTELDGLLRRTLVENIVIVYDRASDLWIAEIDPAQFEAAILNLAINARDAMPGGGQIMIETANADIDAAYAGRHDDVEAGEYVMVAVTDTGTGMPADVVERAFDPFFTTKSEGKGSGLGLSMVYGFVRQSGGHARIDSVAGEGTSLSLYFPRAISPTQRPVESPERAEIGAGDEHVLVVEDDDLVRQNLVAQLTRLGYRVSAASSAEKALELLAVHDDLDLLLTDIIMPGGMNGKELADETQRRWPGLRILFTSGYSEDAIMHDGRVDDGVQLLSKPYQRQELAEKVRWVLDSPPPGTRSGPD